MKDTLEEREFEIENLKREGKIDNERLNGEISYLKSKDENSDARAKVRLTMSQHVGKRERGEKKVVESALAGADEAELRDTERNKNSGMKGMSKNDTQPINY